LKFKINMLQNIIVYVILIAAVGYSVFAVVRNARKKEKSGCDGCDGCEVKNEILKNTKNRVTKDPTTCGCNPQ